jgi:hypothetical protein
MKRRREWMLFAASAAVAVVGLLVSRNQQTSDSTELAAIEESRSVESPRAGSSVTPRMSPNLQQKAELERFRSAWPRPAQVREEVRSDPHHAPPSLLAFARVLGSELERAKKDPEFSLQLLESLEDCVRSTGVIDSARAVCLRQSRRVPGFHPEDARLPVAAARVQEAAPPQVLDLAESLDS